MQYFNKQKKEVLNNNGAQGFRLAQTSLSEIVKLEIEPGGKIPAHSLPINVVFYVIKGEGIALVNDEKYVVDLGDVIEVAAHNQRSWSNISDSMLELLVIKQTIDKK